MKSPAKREPDGAAMQTALFLSETLPLGGTSSFAINICAGMDGSRDWRAVAAALRNKGEIIREMRESGLPVLIPEKTCHLHEERIEEIFRQASKWSPRAVVAALSSGSFDFLRHVPAGTLRIGMIQSDEAGFYELVEQYLPWLDAVAGVSAEICRKMRARLPATNTVPVYHQPYGIPMPASVTPREREGPLRVLYIGRIIEEQKRVSMMQRIIRKSLAARDNIEWTLAGDGPDLPSMRVSFANEPRVRLLGKVDYKDVPAVLARHDVYFLCSDYEGLPLSLLEAMGSGLVPVVSDLPSGISEVVNEDNGIRVSPDDENGFVEALTDLAGDRKRLSAFSSGAREEVFESHSIQAMAKRWERMFEDLQPDSTACEPWPASCRATTPLEFAGQWMFHPAFRHLRSAIKRLRQRRQTRIVQP